MNKYNPEIHHRHSIRLRGYDYSSIGSYFITLCTQNRENLFGTIINNEMLLNNAGEMIKKWVIETENKFKGILIDEYIIMPNHLHLIIAIVGADLCVFPGRLVCSDQKSTHSDLRVCLDIKDDQMKGEHTGSPLREIQISEIIQWFKTMTTNEYIKGVKNNIYPPFDKRLWQRNYYENIIRNEEELNKIREYIINNSANWSNDENNIEVNKAEKVVEEVV